MIDAARLGIGAAVDNLGGLLGLRDGDIVLEIDGQPTRSFEQLLAATERALSQEWATVLVGRGGSVISLRYRRW